MVAAEVPLVAATIILGQRMVAWTKAVIVVVLVIRKGRLRMVYS